MNKTQWVVIALAVVLFSVLYFGFDTKPSSHQTIEEKRGLTAVTSDAGSLVKEAKNPSVSLRILLFHFEMPTPP